MKKKVGIVIGCVAAVAIIATAVIFIFTDIATISNLNNSLNLEEFDYESYSSYGELQNNHVKMNPNLLFYYPASGEGHDYTDIHVADSDRIQITFTVAPGKDDFEYGDWLAMYNENATVDGAGELVYFEVEYLPDQSTSLANQAEAYCNNAKDTKGYKVTDAEQIKWEDMLEDYNLEYVVKDGGHPVYGYILAYDLGVDVWRYKIKDNSNKKIIETLFFEREDGFYRVEMHYPKKDGEARSAVYSMFDSVEFNVDLQNIQEMGENMTIVEESFDAKGTLVIEAENTGDKTTELLICYLVPAGDETRIPSKAVFGIQPGETALFGFSADSIPDEYTIEFASCPGYYRPTDSGEWVAAY